MSLRMTEQEYLDLSDSEYQELLAKRKPVKLGDTVRTPDGRVGKITLDWLGFNDGAKEWDYRLGTRFEVYFGRPRSTRSFHIHELTLVEEGRKRG